MLHQRKILASMSLLGLFMNDAVLAAPLSALSEAVESGKGHLNFRSRYEQVDLTGFSEEAEASTLRSRFTWLSGEIDNFTVGLEVDYVSAIGSEKYNSTTNGKSQYPVVADPTGFDLNQAYINYKRDETSLTAGKQRINHANQRFVGGVAWRQNEQTFDAFRAVFSPLDELSVDYSYVWNVSRIFGPDNGAQPAEWDGTSHLLNAAYTIADGHRLQGFAYFLDFENANGPANSTETVGLSYNGKFDRVSLQATMATQSDYKSSPLDYTAEFYSVSADLKLSVVKLTAGYEELGSDNGVASFRTPLATLHKFQGWADRFLNTPANGIEDSYLGLSGKVGPVMLAATWHTFSADEGGAAYGDELDIVVTYPVNKRISLQFKAADYRADTFSVDTTNVWMTVTLKL
jgi:hypothetical protein